MTDLEGRWQDLAARLEARLPVQTEGAPDAALDDLSAGTRERLRSLGYLD